MAEQSTPGMEQLAQAIRDLVASPRLDRGYLRELREELRQLEREQR